MGRLLRPRVKAPFPTQSGYNGKPTNINNVETWVNVPRIIDLGADWYSSIGTKTSKGTKVFSLVGKVNNTGLVEVPMGVTLREIIFDIGGGIKSGKQFKAVQIGGPSGGCIPADIFDLHTKSPRVAMPTVKPQVRIQNFQQIKTGIPEKSALREAERCLECGCIEGFTCALRTHSTAYEVAADSFPGEKNHYPEYNNLLSGHPPIVRDENKCVTCGICVRVCDEIWSLSVFGYVHSRTGYRPK